MKVKLSDRLIAASLALTERTRVGNALQALFINRYEAAQPSNPKRRYLPAFVRDARFDANSFSRWEMSRKIRYFERNTWLVQRLRDEFVKWTVGPNGLPVIPTSSDPEWNKYMLEDYLRWCESPCLDSTISMPQVHRQIAGEHHIEGGVFVHYTRRKWQGKPSEPVIQLIRGHRVSSPGTEYSASVKEADDLVDGVQLGKDDFGKTITPIGYWVREDFAGESWTFRTTADLQHVYSPEIVGMFREITPYHAVINTLNDVELLEDLEMDRAKANSEDAKIIKTLSGEAPTAEVLSRRRFGNAPSAGAAPDQNAENDARLDMYRRVLGGRTVFLRTNEEIQTPSNSSPSAATQWLWRYKLGQVCAASGVPLILVFPELIESAQGTVVRGIYDNAHEFFRSKTGLFAQSAIRMYRFYANWARYNRPQLADAPADWDSCHIIPPRAVNVDIGYTTESKLAELEAGITDYDTVAGAHGTTADVIFKRKARQIASIKRIAKEISLETGEEVKPEEIAGGLADIIEKLANAQPDEPDGDEPPAPKKKKEAIAT